MRPESRGGNHFENISLPSLGADLLFIAKKKKKKTQRIKEVGRGSSTLEFCGPVKFVKKKKNQGGVIVG